MRPSSGLWQHRPMRRVAALLVGAAVLAGCGGGHHAVQTDPPAAKHRRAVSPPAIRSLVARPAGTLQSPVQDAAAAPFSGGAVLIGGLTPADVSTSEIVTATRAGSRRVGSIPTALHDSAAV